VPVAEILGEFDERFRGVADALARNLDDGVDVGASVAVVLDGEVVVDIWGGKKALSDGGAWDRETIVNVFSTTKTMTALCALILADRRELNLDAPVAHYLARVCPGRQGPNRGARVTRAHVRSLRLGGAAGTRGARQVGPL
jgi:CubicO group peptidase (beta-lactamase class C family)